MWSNSANDQLRDANRIPKRILMTADAVGGVWTYSLELARAFLPHGVEVILASMGPRPTAEQRNEATCLGNVTLVESDYRLEWMDDPWRDVADAGLWLLDLEQQFAPDIIHLNGYSHAAIRWKQPVVVVAHSCVASWWQAVKRTSLPAVWTNYCRHVRRGLCAAQSVVAPSYAMADCIRQHYAAHCPIEVIYNAADQRAFLPSAKQNVVFAAGRLWDEAKNMQALAKAAGELSWPVVIAGDHRATAGQVHDCKNVHFAGRLSRDQIIQTMAQSAIYALPARYEPFGLSILEAALAGCALVLGDIPSLREIWGFTATYVDPDDPLHIALKIRELINDHARRSELAQAARSRAVAFTPARMAAQYLGLYDRLLQRHLLRHRRSEHGSRSHVSNPARFMPTMQPVTGAVPCES